MRATFLTLLRIDIECKNPLRESQSLRGVDSPEGDISRCEGMTSYKLCLIVESFCSRSVVVRSEKTKAQSVAGGNRLSIDCNHRIER